MQRSTGLRTFSDRTRAGLELAQALREYHWLDPVVLGLARGGVTVAAAVARELTAPLDVAVVRKIGAPGHPEFGIGATTARQEPTYDQRSLDQLRLTRTDLADVAAEHRAEAQRMLDLYNGDRESVPRQGRDVILVDDGLATGVSATTGLRAEHAARPRTLTFAIPVGAGDAVSALRAEADRVVCLAEPEPFGSVGQWYKEFDQVTDDEVVATLRAADERVHDAR